MANALKKSGKTNVWLLFCFILSVRDAGHSKSSRPFFHTLLDQPFLQLPSSPTPTPYCAELVEQANGFSLVEGGGGAGGWGF